MFVVDTNVLVYGANRRSPFHATCHDFLEDCKSRAPAWYLTWGIIYEFLRVVTHPKVLGRPWTAVEAWNFVEVLRASPSLGILVATDRHAQVAAAVLREIPHLSGNLIHDAHTAMLMREHGILRIVTRDTDFHRFPFIEPIDPMARAFQW